MKRYAFWSIGILLALYALFFFHFLDTWQMENDDGGTLLCARRLLAQAGLPLFGEDTSFGVAYPPWIYLLYDFFYKIWPSVSGIQIGIIAMHLATHVLLILSGMELGSLGLGISASLMFFFAPGFFVYFDQKFWEPATAPFFALLSLWLTLRAVNKNSIKLLLLGILAASIGIGAHATCFFLFPALLAAERIAFRRILKEPKIFIAACVFFSLGTYPTWIWVVEKFGNSHTGMSILISIVVLSVLGFLALDLRIFRNRAAYSISALLILVSVIYFLKPNLFTAVEHFANIFSAFTPALPKHIGSGASSWPNWLQYSLELPVLLVFAIRSLYRWNELSRINRIFYLWCLFPSVIISLLPLTNRSFESQWCVVIAAPLYLALAKTTYELCLQIPQSFRILRPILPVVVLMAWLSIAGTASFSSLSFVRSSGGVGDHLASLDTKRRVLDRMTGVNGARRIFILGDPQHGIIKPQGLGWKAIANLDHYQDKAQVAVSPTGYFYLYQLGTRNEPDSEAIQFQEMSQNLKVTHEEIGSIEIFKSDQEIPEAGTAILSL